MRPDDLRRAIRAASRVFEAAERTHRPGSQKHWQSLTVREHLAHAARHAEQAILGMGDEDHLVHALCRLMLCVELRERNAEEKSRGR